MLWRLLAIFLIIFVVRICLKKPQEFKGNGNTIPKPVWCETDTECDEWMQKKTMKTLYDSYLKKYPEVHSQSGRRLQENYIYNVIESEILKKKKNTAFVKELMRRVYNELPMLTAKLELGERMQCEPFDNVKIHKEFAAPC